ncbi:hypothetical protein [Parapedobacter lycopersici]|uniref:hypothetical protein n=1 Tax=Parapedobacter lycopersici TaxID=1864939 RepID=UPI00214D29E1|nr:hypothetical protein [Parapedobacter lycopersici]
MKRLLLLFIGASTAAALSSCTKTELVENTANRSYVYTILQNQWQWDNGVTYQVYYDKAIPALTDYYLLEGSVNVAISFDDEASYDILPTTFNGVAYSVNYTVGNVTIYAEDPLADSEIEVPLPENAVVKVILSEADFAGEL